VEKRSRPPLHLDLTELVVPDPTSCSSEHSRTEVERSVADGRMKGLAWLSVVNSRQDGRNLSRPKLIGKFEVRFE